MRRPTPGQQPGLGAMERDGQVGPDGRVGRPRSRGRPRSGCRRKPPGYRQPMRAGSARPCCGSVRAGRRGRPSRGGHRPRLRPRRCPVRASPHRAPPACGRSGCRHHARSVPVACRGGTLRPGLRCHEDDDDLGPGEGQAARRTNPSPPLLPGPAKMTIGPRPHRSRSTASARTAAATAVPACSMSRSSGMPSACAR